MRRKKEKRARDFLGELEAQLKKRFGRKGEPRFFRAPGRVDWLGSHTDYNQGLILAGTVDREVIACARLRKDGALNFYSLNLDQEVRTNLKDNVPNPQHGFANYPKGVIYEFCQTGIEISGIDLVFYGDIPIGANLSSSAALEVVTLESVLGLMDLVMTRWEKAFICWRAENRFVGMPCGILDQFTIINSEKDHLLYLDCDRLSSELIPCALRAKAQNKSHIPRKDSKEMDQLSLLVIDSGVGRQLVKSEYQKRVLECRRAYQELRRAGYRIRNLSELKPEQLKGMEKKLEPVLFRRVRHIVTENERVRRAKQALEAKNFLELGRLFDQGYLSSSQDYENSIPELDLLHQLLSEFPGILGTRIAGAGWGGCLVSLAREPDLEKLEATLCQSYQKRTGKEFRIFSVATGFAPGELA